MLDDIILENLGDSVCKPTTPDAGNHHPYSNSINSDSTQLSDDNDPDMPDSTTVLRNLSLIN